ncbi:MAG: porin family protein [Acidiferrobacterales bacterium]|nr:porin family protein [Acidiferrobacterales bacterium]
MKKIVSAACLAAVVTATPALAAEKGTTWLEAGWAFGNLDNPSGSPSNLRLGAGFYFVDNIAAEVQFLTAAQADGAVKIDSGYGVFARGEFPMSKNINLFGRVGYTNIDLPGGSKSGFGYGAGLSFGAGEKMTIDADYTIYQNDSSSTFGAATIAARYLIK